MDLKTTILEDGVAVDEDEVAPDTNPLSEAVVGRATANLMSGGPRYSRRRKKSAKRNQ